MDETNENKFKELVDRMISINVEQEEALPLIEKYIKNQPITEIELIKIYSYLSELIAKYENDFGNNIDPKEKAKFHDIIDCFKNYVINLTPIEKYLIDRYDKACQKEIDTAEGLSNGFTKRKTHPHYNSGTFEESLELNPHAFTLIPIIITVTVLLGTIIAAVLLVK